MTDGQPGSITGEMSRISIFTFFAVAEQLGLDETEQRQFLENPDEIEFVDWRDNGAGIFSAILFMKVNALVRLSAIINNRFSFEEAHRWLRTPDALPNLDGRTPAEMIATASLSDLAVLQKQLER